MSHGQKACISAETMETVERLRSCGRYGGVYLYFGHDGDNGCELKDYEGNRVVYECSGRSMDEAVRNADHEQHYGDKSMIRQAIKDTSCYPFGEGDWRFATRLLELERQRADQKGEVA